MDGIFGARNPNSSGEEETEDADVFEADEALNVEYESGSFCLARTKMYHMLLHSKAKYLTFLFKQVEAVKRNKPRDAQSEVEKVVARLAGKHHHKICKMIDLAGNLYISSGDIRGKIDAILYQLDELDDTKLKYHDTTQWMVSEDDDHAVEYQAQRKRYEAPSGHPVHGSNDRRVAGNGDVPSTTQEKLPQGKSRAWIIEEEEEILDDEPAQPSQDKKEDETLQPTQRYASTYIYFSVGKHELTYTSCVLVL